MARKRSGSEDTGVVPEWFTMKQAAQLVGLADTTLYAWSRDGTLPAAIVSRPGGRAVRISRTGLLRFMEDQATDAA
jgi:excisionase family DNA binding protein